jgi:hypothetical protein
VHLADIDQIPRLLRYFPSEMPRKPTKKALETSQRQANRFHEAAIDSEDQDEEFNAD